MDLGTHTGFIWASYAAVLVILGLLILWLAADGRRQQRRLHKLEARGIRAAASQTRIFHGSIGRIELGGRTMDKRAIARTRN